MMTLKGPNILSESFFDGQVTWKNSMQTYASDPNGKSGGAI